MSKKKERKIKRLRRRAIWPAVVEMIITETIILVLTSLICVLALFGIVNTVVMQNMKESNTLVQTVNESWNTESHTDLQNRLSEYTNTFNDITEIIIDDRNSITTLFPVLEPFYNDESQRILNDTGMIHFIDPDFSKPFDTLSDNITKDYKIIRHYRIKVNNNDFDDDDFDPDDYDFDFEDFVLIGDLHRAGVFLRYLGNTRKPVTV